ncbi:MAG TPA: carboxypeptidase-like regulatory domain-containing protein, partial [Acidobacteriaceae bacterium]|nr:carboxypeptidase-like regulatory domain-containing protein [Acidobacteriaceae bacterium]
MQGNNRSSSTRGFYISFLLLLCALFAGSGVARAQLAGKGELKGTVTDPSGAVVPNATVTAVQTTTGQAISRTTNSSGIYDISPLDPGIYTVTIEAQGFRKQTQADVHVNALEIADYSPALTLGSSTETVTVTSAPPQLETSNATLGATMEQDMYSALPIEMGAYGNPDQRRATDFAFLMPGVQGNNTNGNPTTNTGVVNGSGSRGAVSDVYIDGLPFVRAGGNGDPRFVWTAISVDAVEQFQVQTTGYGAMYEGQGVQNYTIKAGGKNFHGGVYEFFRNTALDTWGFFKANDPRTGLPTKPVEHSNEYGINLSGPLVPFGALREKLFFFGNYNGFRYTSETPTQLTFPTAAQQAGNFQGVLGTNSGSELQSPYFQVPNSNPAKYQNSVGVYDPSTQTACTANSTDGPCRYRYGYVAGTGKGPRGNPAIGPGGVATVDVIPVSQLSAVALKMQSYLPSGIGTALQNNFISPNRTGLTNWSTTERIDFNMSQKDTFSAIAAIGRQASSNPVGQTTAGRNVGPIPYNYGQTYAPK